MSSSIRTFLLINLLLCVTLITSLAIIGNLFLEHHNLQAHLDTQLSTTGLIIQAFTEDNVLQGNEIREVQENINKLPEQIESLISKADPKARKSFATKERIQFQIWDNQGNLLISSEGAPKKPFAVGKSGFSDKVVHAVPWRVFTTYSIVSGYRVEVAERYNVRKELEGRITQDSVFVMLITYPFLGLLVWIIIGRGLDSIKKVTREIRRRAPTHLAPLEFVGVPKEIQPFIDELNELFLRLREGFEREKRFAADAAHELKTPLAALRTYSQLAMKSKTEDERNAALEKIISSVKRSTHIVQQLLTLSRMVPEASLSELQDLDLRAIATEIISDLVPKAVKKDTEIEFVAQEDAVEMQGSETAIGILVRNLVDNAIRYTPAGSSVKVEVMQRPNSAVLIVTDNGPGIPKELRARVFERFFRVLGTSASGSGLGLGIVQQIAQLHKARVILDTPESGQGLEVTVVFPRSLS